MGLARLVTANGPPSIANMASLAGHRCQWLWMRRVFSGKLQENEDLSSNWEFFTQLHYVFNMTVSQDSSLGQAFPKGFKIVQPLRQPWIMVSMVDIITMAMSCQAWRAIPPVTPSAWAPEG